MDKVRILYLSNYKISKGVLLLVDVLKSLKEKGLPFFARLVGGPSDVSIEDLKIYIKERDLEKDIEVTGPKYDQDKYVEFQKADIFVFPTYYSNETFGIVNLEAMQFCLPIITTDEGGIAEVVTDNETGFVIEPRNVKQLEDKLEILLKDQQLRVDMGRRGHEAFLNHFTVQHFEKNLKKVFDSILQKKED